MFSRVRTYVDDSNILRWCPAPNCELAAVRILNPNSSHESPVVSEAPQT